MCLSVLDHKVPTYRTGSGGCGDYSFLALVDVAYRTTALDTDQSELFGIQLLAAILHPRCLLRRLTHNMLSRKILLEKRCALRMTCQCDQISMNR